MKRIILGLCLLSVNMFAEAQNSLPSYPAVLQHFFSEYKIPDSYDSAFNLAKKKDGWYIQLVNRIDNDRLVYEKKYWSVSKQAYEGGGERFENQSDQAEAETNISNYLGPSAYNRWYDYERCMYFGYPGWDDDLIRDFGEKEITSDTLLEGLARAYSFKAQTYLWYQAGGSVLNADPLQVKLDPLQKPSAARIEKVVYYVNKAIDTYEKLVRLNPAYVNIVGNISLKQFNEAMSGWSQLKMSGEEEKAVSFLERATLEQHYIDQAKNYLNSCDPNAILFTYGDNDTYQLWYVQEKLNYRKDVAVINNSLLGLPRYVDMLKNKMLGFTAPVSFYGNSGGEVSYYQQSAKGAVKNNMQMNALLAGLYSGKNKFVASSFPEGSPAYNAYSADAATITINPAEFNQRSAVKTTARKLTVKTGNYMLLNDVLILDIVNTNLNKRPIYFTTAYYTKFFDSSLLQQGIVFRLIPLNKAERSAAAIQEIKALEQFATVVYKPVVDFNVGGTRHHSYDGSNAFLSLYTKIAAWYQQKNNAVKVRSWIKKLNDIAPALTVDHIPAAYDLLGIYKQYDKQQLEKDAATYAEWTYQRATRFSAITGYLSREDCIRNLAFMIDSGLAPGINEKVLRPMMESLGKKE